MSRRHGDPESEPTDAEWLLLVGLVAAAIAVAAIPLALGIVVTILVPGSVGVRPGTPALFLAGWLAIVVVLGIILGPLLDRAVSYRMRPFGPRTSKAATEGAGLALLVVLLLPVMNNWLSAVLAALVTTLISLLATPFVDRLAEKRSAGVPDPDEKP